MTTITPKEIAQMQLGQIRKEFGHLLNEGVWFGQAAIKMLERCEEELALVHRIAFDLKRQLDEEQKRQNANPK